MCTGLQIPDDLELVRHWNSSLILFGFHVCLLPLLCVAFCVSYAPSSRSTDEELLSEANMLTTVCSYMDGFPSVI